MARGVSHARGRPKPERKPASSLPAGANLYDSDHPCRRTYLLESGLIRVSSDHAAIVAHLTPGSFFGEKCFLKQVPSAQQATSLSPVRVTAFGKSELLDLLQSDRQFALQFIKNLALRIEHYEQTIRDFVTEEAEQRLARLLLRVAPARATSGWVQLPIDPTNAELSRMVGTTRPRISRFMRHFQKSGWVRHDRGLWIQLEGLRGFLELPKFHDGIEPAATDDPAAPKSKVVWKIPRLR